jgi:hypothetical protein
MSNKYHHEEFVLRELSWFKDNEFYEKIQKIRNS